MKEPSKSRIKQIVSDIIENAQKRQERWERDSVDIDGQPKFHDVSSSMAALERSYSDPLEEKLETYLKACSHEEIIGLMTLMYIGRDSRDTKLSNPSEHFSKRFIEFSNWEKDIAIDQMMEKGPFYDYLKSGLKLLNM